METLYYQTERYSDVNENMLQCNMNSLICDAWLPGSSPPLEIRIGSDILWQVQTIIILLIYSE